MKPGPPALDRAQALPRCYLNTVPVIRHYRLNAAAGKSAQLAASLSELAATLKRLPGFLSAEILVGVDRADHFVFVEKWASVEARRDSAPQMPKAIMASIMSAIAGRPEITELTYLRTV